MTECAWCGCVGTHEPLCLGSVTIRGPLEDYLDPAAAGAAAERGVAQSFDNAEAEAKALALRAIREVASAHRYFTSEDVWQHLHGPLAATWIDPSRGSFLGGVLRVACREGLIALAVGRVRASKRPANHKRILRVWRSLLAGAEGDRGELADVFEREPARLWTGAEVARAIRGAE